jgi:GAF domain-containing protein
VNDREDLSPWRGDATTRPHEERLSDSAQELAARLARLQHLTSELSRAATVDAVSDAVVTTVMADLDAREAWLCLLHEEGERFEVVRQAGAVAETIEAWRSFPRRAELPAGDALDRREAVAWESLAERDRIYPLLRRVEMAQEAYVIAPMIVDDVEVGVTIFGFAGPRSLSSADRAFVQAATDQAAQAIRRAHLLEEQQQAHAWQRFLADAGMLLARAGLDPACVLGEVARMTVPVLADGCVVHLAENEGLRPVACAHADPAVEADLHTLVEERAVSRNPFLAEAAATQQPVAVESLAEPRPSGDGERPHFDAVAGLAVPLLSRDAVVGILTLLHDPARRFGIRERIVARDLAARAALAIDNARGHAEVAQLAGQLQEALSTRVIIEQAKGMLAERHRLHPDQAFGLLREQARRSGRKLHALAAEVLDGSATIAPAKAQPRRSLDAR